MDASTIPRLVDAAADRFGDHEAFVDGDIRWSFTGYRDQIHRAARALMARGIQPDDRVAVWAPNIAEWAVAALGVHCVGGVLVPINTRFKGREAGDLLDRTSARLLFTVTDFLDTDYVGLLREAGVDGVDTVILRGSVPDGCTPWREFTAMADRIDDTERTMRSAAVGPDDFCNIMFTSGTTGAPKGAMLRHGAVCRSYRSWCDVIGLGEDDRYLVVNPFFHSFGLHAGILACLMTGATLVPHPVFDVPSVMARVPEERISVLPGPPAIYQMILNHPDLDDFDMSTLRLAVTGAAPVPVPMIEAMRQRLGFETIITGYGLTEASGIATMCRHDDPPELISGSSGRALDEVEVLVVDADGWLHTGYIGVMDENGYLDITDRLKDMFINGGFNVYPAEVESLLLAHPLIGRVAVVGVHDERLGEVGMAFVVPATGAEPDPAEIISWARREMANYKAPRHVEVVDDLPVNASGKVLKQVLRDRAVALLNS